MVTSLPAETDIPPAGSWVSRRCQSWSCNQRWTWATVSPWPCRVLVARAGHRDDVVHEDMLNGCQKRSKKAAYR